jgi:hypothetical protein
MVIGRITRPEQTGAQNRGKEEAVLHAQKLQSLGRMAKWGWLHGGIRCCEFLKHSSHALRPLRTMAFFAFSLALLKRKGRGGSQRTPRARKFRAPQRILLHPFSIFHSPSSIIHHQSSIIH